MTSATKWLAALCCLTVLATARGTGQDRYWDPALASGNWDTTTAIWGIASGGPYTNPWADGSVAHLDSTVSGGSTATLTAHVETGNINFSGLFTIQAGSGGALRVANGATIAGTTGAELSIDTKIMGAASLTFSGGTVHLNFNDLLQTNGIQINANTRVTIGHAAALKSGLLGQDASVTLNASSAVISFESTQTYGRVVSGTGQLDVVSSVSGSTTLTLSNANTLTGPVNVFDGSTLALANSGSSTSGSIASAGGINLDVKATLDVTGHTVGTWTLGNGQSLATAGGTADGGQITGNSRIVGTVAPGAISASPNISGALQVDGGTMSLVGGSTAGTRSTYEWGIDNWTGTTAGTHYSQLTGVGGAKLDLSEASTTNKVRLLISGEADIANFNSSVPGSWVIADFSAGNSSGGIIGFDANKFLIDTSEFARPLDGGTFSISTDANNNQIILTFAPVPEPAWMLALAAGTLLAGRRIRRKFRPAHAQPV